MRRCVTDNVGYMQAERKVNKTNEVSDGERIKSRAKRKREIIQKFVITFKDLDKLIHVYEEHLKNKTYKQRIRKLRCKQISKKYRLSILSARI